MIRTRFSLLEVIIVLVILVLVVTISVGGISERSPGEVRIEVTDALKQVFQNASIRSQAFGTRTEVKIQVDSDGFFTCNLSSGEKPPHLSGHEESEEQRIARLDEENSRYIWSGKDEYQIADAKLTEYEEIVDENNQITFNFFPDGEATGPTLKVKILEQNYLLTVDRLNGQLVFQEEQF